MASKHFLDLMEQLEKLHIKKNADYANDNNPFQNFDYAATIVSWFDDPIDQVFACLIGVKLARIAELIRNKKTPNNESLDDSFMDLTCYCGLWTAYYRSNILSNEVKPVEKPPLPILCQMCEYHKRAGEKAHIEHIIYGHDGVLNNKQNTLTYTNSDGVRVVHVF